MPPFSLPKSTKIASKIDLGRHQFFDRFLNHFFIDFCSIWEANLAPCWPLFRSKGGGAVACSPLLCWVFVLFRLFGRPDPLLSKNVARGPRFWKVLGSIFEGFGLYFGGFWCQFGPTTTLGKSTAPLGKPGLSIHSAGVWFWMGW